MGESAVPRSGSRWGPGTPYLRAGAAIAGSLILLVGLGSSAPPSFAAVKLGQTQESYLCAAKADLIQSRAKEVSYAAPSTGRLTQWQINGGADAGTVRFEVWRPKSGNDYKLVYIGPKTNLVAGNVKRVDLSPNVHVRTGDVIGLRTHTQADCAFQTHSSTDTTLARTGQPAPVIGSTYTFSSAPPGFLLNIAASFS